MAFIKKLFSFIIMLSAMLAVSCSDEDDDSDQNPDPEDCKVTAYRCGNRDESWVIVCNTAGNIDSVKIGNYAMTSWSEIRTFDYIEQTGEHSILVKKYSDGTLYGTSKVETDNLGKILSIRDISPAIPPGVETWEMTSYVYQLDIPSMVDKSILSFSGSDANFDSYYSWETANPVGWNMTFYSADGGVYEYEYYLSHYTQPGDYQNFEKIISAYDKYHRPFTSANLLKAIYLDDELVVDVTYIFDSNDVITGFTLEWPDSPTENWEVIYECE